MSPEADVVLWNWNTIPGGGGLRWLQPTAGNDEDSEHIKLAPYQGREIEGTGPERKLYLLVEMNSRYEIVSSKWMTWVEAEVANSYINYYGDGYMLAADYTARTGFDLPEEFVHGD
jgi:hypothetical protein